ncbi:hypothetical protein ACKUB1_09715 [Methanospirillum stamsii]|uniref:Uncharacterized protein n=1 Tax=Methanospirillum stamsii TaxID=1277351 RepID=A0A2V2N5I5_9EURY|nr:hypothetical protein [Methanospirillum stamsii]PWR75354.1 hypothetical protein DLD82_04255 [Methanospirillum stamsii]
MSGYLKVGRLLPGENDEILVIVDGSGEIGRVTKADVILTCGGVEPFPILPSGEMDLSTPGKAVKFTVNGVLFLAIRRQVVNMINKWPRRKAALFGVVE